MAQDALQAVRPLGLQVFVSATTVTGDAVCRSTNVTYRLDTQSARAFVAHYVTLP